MRIRAQPWLFLSLLAVATAAILFSIHSYKYRFVKSNADLVALLPRQNTTLFFAEIALLRRAGILHLLAGPKAGSDPEYADFLRQTRFDYQRDLDVVAAAFDEKQVFFVVRGRFEWSRLRRYAMAHGGACTDDLCHAPTSKPGRWAGFFLIQPDVIALALSEDRAAVDALRPHAQNTREEWPPKPVWIKLSKNLLSDPAAFPPAVRIFAITLQSADSVVLSAEPSARRRHAAFELELDARFPIPAAADTARNQLQIQTKMLVLALARANQRPDPADITGLLTAGTFRVEGKRVIGRWPVRQELLNSLQ